LRDDTSAARRLLKANATARSQGEDDMSFMHLSDNSDVLDADPPRAPSECSAAEVITSPEILALGENVAPDAGGGRQGSLLGAGATSLFQGLF
jgi:hypothetical protein